MLGIGLAGLMSASCSLSAPTPDPAAYAAMNCNEINQSIGGVSTQISRTAITRGRVTQTNVPAWLPGGQRVAAAVVERQTARIEGLQEQERAMVPARAATCRR